MFRRKRKMHMSRLSASDIPIITLAINSIMRNK